MNERMNGKLIIILVITECLLFSVTFVNKKKCKNLWKVKASNIPVHRTILLYGYDLDGLNTKTKHYYKMTKLKDCDQQEYHWMLLNAYKWLTDLRLSWTQAGRPRMETKPNQQCPSQRELCGNNWSNKVCACVCVCCEILIAESASGWVGGWFVDVDTMSLHCN